MKGAHESQERLQISDPGDFKKKMSVRLGTIASREGTAGNG